MLTYDELLDLGLSHGKTHVQAVGKLVKTNENQSIRIQKFNPIFWGKRSLRTAVNPKLIAVKFRGSPWNNKSLRSAPRWAKLCNLRQKVRKLKLFQQGMVLQDNFYRTALWGGLNWVTETGCFHFLPNYNQEIYINTYSKRHQPQNENKEKHIFTWLREPISF